MEELQQKKYQVFFPKLTLEDAKEIEAEVMQLA